MQLTYNTFIYSLFSLGPYIILQLVSVYDALIARHNDLGLFSACNVIVGGLWVVVRNTYLSVYPRISSAAQHKETAQQLNADIAKSSLVGIVLCVLLYIIIVVFGREFLSHFGSLYVSAYTVLLLMGFGIVF